MGEISNPNSPVITKSLVPPKPKSPDNKLKAVKYVVAPDQPQLVPDYQHRSRAFTVIPISEDCPFIRWCAWYHSQLEMVRLHARFFKKEFFLWENIFPQTAPDESVPAHRRLPGLPQFAVRGKYVIRMFLDGDWRGVAIDDLCPVIANGYCPLDIGGSLWSVLMGKALIKAFHAYFKAGKEYDIPVIQALTGWVPSVRTNVLMNSVELDSIPASSFGPDGPPRRLVYTAIGTTDGLDQLVGAPGWKPVDGAWVAGECQPHHLDVWTVYDPNNAGGVRSVDRFQREVSRGPHWLVPSTIHQHGFTRPTKWNSTSPYRSNVQSYITVRCDAPVTAFIQFAPSDVCADPSTFSVSRASDQVGSDPLELVATSTTASRPFVNLECSAGTNVIVIDCDPRNRGPGMLMVGLSPIRRLSGATTPQVLLSEDVRTVRDLLCPSRCRMQILRSTSEAGPSLLAKEVIRVAPGGGIRIVGPVAVPPLEVHVFTSDGTSLIGRTSLSMPMTDIPAAEAEAVLIIRSCFSSPPTPPASRSKQAPVINTVDLTIIGAQSIESLQSTSPSRIGYVLPASSQIVERITVLKPVACTLSVVTDADYLEMAVYLVNAPAGADDARNPLVFQSLGDLRKSIEVVHRMSGSPPLLIPCLSMVPGEVYVLTTTARTTSHWTLQFFITEGSTSDIEIGRDTTQSDIETRLRHEWASRSQEAKLVTEFLTEYGGITDGAGKVAYVHTKLLESEWNLSSALTAASSDGGQEPTKALFTPRDWAFTPPPLDEVALGIVRKSVEDRNRCYRQLAEAVNAVEADIMHDIKDALQDSTDAHLASAFPELVASATDYTCVKAIYMRIKATMFVPAIEPVLMNQMDKQ